jgi:diacylglycerol kinase family enzyme
MHKLGFIPVDSGNDLAQSLGMPAHIDGEVLTPKGKEFTFEILDQFLKVCV